MPNSRKFTSDSVFCSLAYIYIALPVCIFMLGWLKPVFSIPLVILIIICLVRIVLNNRHNPAISDNFRLSRSAIIKLFVAAAFIIIWACLSGIGGVSFQVSDHYWRNTIFEILVNHDWPVRYEIVTAEGTSVRELIYYIGFWLPAAFVGKVLGLHAGFIFQTIWACIGCFITYYLICRKFKNVRLWYLLLFVLFSGLDVIGATLLRNAIPNYMYYDGLSIYSPLSTTHLEWWCDYQYSSITTQLFWVFNQALPAWIATLLLIQRDDNRYRIFILGSLLLCSPFPLVGLLPFVFYWIVKRQKGLFSFENIVGGGISGIVSFLYLRANSASQMHGTNAATLSFPVKYIMAAIVLLIIGGFLYYFVRFKNQKRLLYLVGIVLLGAGLAYSVHAGFDFCVKIGVLGVFILLEAGVYYVLIFKYQKKEPLYYITFIWLCICPLLTVGAGQDFCMRASVPALLFLYLMVTDTLIQTAKKRSYIHCALICIVLLIGAITPVHEIYRSIRYTIDFHTSRVDILSNKANEEDTMRADNFSGVRSGDKIYSLLFK